MAPTGTPFTEDVKTFVSLRPVSAWGHDRHIKLNARSFEHYDLSEPTRKDVFKANYNRRLNQRKSQGYFSAPWRPYQDVGQPLYLDSKTLVKTALGQEKDESQQHVYLRTDSTRSFQSSEALQELGKRGKRMSTASFLLQHRRHRDLENITKYLTNVNETKSYVKMGQSLFQILKKEKHDREITVQEEKMKEIQERSEDDNDSSSEDVNEEEKLRQEFMERKKAAMQRRMSLKTFTRPASSPVVQPTKPAQESSSGGLLAVKAKKKKSQSERVPPFTPRQAPNIMIKNKPSVFSSSSDKEKLRKQLCVLHWLIEACNLEITTRHGLTNYLPMVKCWESETKPGGRMVEISKRPKKPELWNQFLTRSGSTTKTPRTRMRRGVSRYNLIKKVPSFAEMNNSLEGKRTPSSPRLSIRSHQSIPSPSPMSGILLNFEPPDSEARPSSPAQSSVTTTIAAGGTIGGSEIDDETITIQSSGVEEDDISQYHSNLQKLLSTVKENVDKEMSLREKVADDKAETEGKLREPVYLWAKQLYIEELNKDEKEEQQPISTKPKATLRPSLKPQTSIKIRPHTAAPHKKVVMSDFSNEAVPPPSRPKSSPAKLTTLTGLLSSRKEKMPGEMREKFKEITDVKALELHNQLGELARKRYERMEKKFEAFKRPQSSMHRDLEHMRTAVSMESEHEKKEQTALTCSDYAKKTEWYCILINNINIMLTWNDKGEVENEEFKFIMKRLMFLAAKASGWEPDEKNDDPLSSRRNSMRRRFSVFSNRSSMKNIEITPDAFLRVLETLRVWELCAAEVSAAIEFVREFVIGMPPQQYEEWRSERLQRETQLSRT